MEIKLLSNEIHATLYSNITIDKDDLLPKIDKVKSPLIKPYAELFKENIDTVSNLLALPARLASHSFIYYAIIKSLADSGPDVDVEKFATNYYNKYYNQEGRKKVIEITIPFLSKLLPYESELTKSIQALLYSAVLNTWSSFEKLANNVWLSLITQPQYKQTKKVSTYAFSSIGRINQAYKDISLETTIKVVTNNPDLLLLEKTRHLIAHQQGIMDQIYKDVLGIITTPTNTLSFTPIGEAVFINMELERQFIETVLKAGYDLITSIDNILNPIK